MNHPQLPLGLALRDSARFESYFPGRNQEALRNLPRSIRDYVEGVPVLVEEFPASELVEKENVSPQILGR